MRDKIVKELVHVAAGMDDHELAGVPHDPVHPGEGRLDEFLPERITHLQASLGAPIVPEIDRVDIEGQGPPDLGDVIVGDGVQELMDEAGMVVKSP